MGKIGGFLNYKRKNANTIDPFIRIQNFEEFHLSLTHEERKEQAARCMDCGVPFCQYGKNIAGRPSGCPLHNLIPEWNDLLYRNHYEEALERLLHTDIFPEFTSRVCPSPCEKACTCALNGEAVSICENEKAIIEYAFSNHLMKPKKDLLRSGKRIAIIGSGPSGLACAWQLNRRGHQVSVFERNDRVGGLLMYGIPNMKLDKKIVQRRIDLMKDEGISFHVNHNINQKEQVTALKEEYDAIVIACGASQPRDLNVVGRDAKGIYFAVDFLRETTKALLDSDEIAQTMSAKNKHVLVIGGGDTGNDCIGTSIRQGCASVTQLEMMPCLPKARLDSNPWPEWPNVMKTDYGQEEAIAVFGQDPRMYETTVKEFLKDENGNVVQAVLVKVGWEQDLKSGKKRLQPIAGSEKVIDCDIVFIAAGFVGAEPSTCAAFRVEQNEYTSIKEDGNYKTNQEKVFVCGDAKRGQSLVVWAIQEGKQAAKAVDEYIMGYSNL